MQTYSGAQIACILLQRQGVKVVFGIPGGFILPFYDALSQSPIRHVLARHEQGAGFMAQGVARSTGQVGVAIVTSGPGVANLLTAIADAKADSVPLVCISGQVPQSLLGTDAFQEIDALGLARPITKAAFMARRPEDLLHLIPEAFRLAASGRPGPVLIDFPKDVQVATCTSLGKSMSTGPGRPDAARRKASGMRCSRSSGRRAMKAALVMGRANPRASISWKASVPSRLWGTWPLMQTRGTLSALASAMAVSRLATPGPEVTMATPTWPVDRATPWAMKPAPCSWRASTWRMGLCESAS